MLGRPICAFSGGVGIFHQSIRPVLSCILEMYEGIYEEINGAVGFVLHGRKMECMA